MSEFNYLREKARMTKYLGRQNDYCDGYCDCRRCTLTTTTLSCTELETKCPEEATELVRKWAEEHPRKTRKDILLEKFPNAKVSHVGRARICAYALGLVSEEEYQEKCCEYPTSICAGCWNTEVEE